MKKMSRTAQAVFSVFLVFALLCGLGSAFAASVPELDMGREGSVTVSLSGDDGGAVSGGELTICQVGRLSLEDGEKAGDMSYVLTEDFRDSGVTLDGESLRDPAGLAAALAAFAAENDIAGITMEIPDSGEAAFTGLELGLYLIVQTSPSPWYYPIEPFIVTVPYGDEVTGEWVYDVTAAAKTELVPHADSVMEQVSFGKRVSQAENTRVAPDEFEFRVTLSRRGLPVTGDLAAFYEDSPEELTVFFDSEGTAVITLEPGRNLTVSVPYGTELTVEELTAGADTVTAYVGDDAVLHVEAEGQISEAKADIGFIADSTQVLFVNSYREYFGIDEEIVTDEEDIFNTDRWVKDEAVNEYHAIEMEMTTVIPVMTAYDLENGAFTMSFHNELDSELVLDEADADFSVYITRADGSRFPVPHDYYEVTISPEDSCSFHVDVDLSGLYRDGYISEEDLNGDALITLFFFADLEGTGLNGSYRSTVWYELYDGKELLYTSNTDVVWVYTFDILLIKYDDRTGEILAGAEFGLYYDEGCADPVIRNGGPYTATSGDDGTAEFYGLADGVYYLKELRSPEGYILSGEVAAVVLGLDEEPDMNADVDPSDLVCEIRFANTPGENPEPTPTPFLGRPNKRVDTSGNGIFSDDGQSVAVGDTLSYEITYYNDHDGSVAVTVTDTLDSGLTFVSASDGGVYEDGTVTWVLEDVEAMASGTVTVTARVNDSAELVVTNTAYVQVGDDPAIETNAVENPVTPEEQVPAPTPGQETPAPTGQPGTEEPAPTPAPTETPAPSETPEATPAPTPTAAPSSGGEPAGPGSSNPGSSGGDSGAGGSLPQTGMIFWPIIVLAAAGAIFITAGVIVRKRRNA